MVDLNELRRRFTSSGIHMLMRNKDEGDEFMVILSVWRWANCVLFWESYLRKWWRGVSLLRSAEGEGRFILSFSLRIESETFITIVCVSFGNHGD